MTLHQSLRTLALLLIVSGLAGIIPINYFRLQNQLAVSQPVVSAVSTQPVPAKPGITLVAGKPISLSIPSLHIDLPVIDGNYDQKTGEWTLTSNKAQFATPSLPPNNEMGNTLLYGHYRPEVFAYLHLIKPGAQALVATANGLAFNYTYDTTEALDPRDTSVFSYQGDPRLTIQTCSGTFMQHRQMYYFHYTGFTKA